MWTDPHIPTRRAFLARSAFGIGAFALADLLNRDRLLGSPEKIGENLPLDLKARLPHFAPRRGRLALFEIRRAQVEHGERVIAQVPAFQVQQP